MDSSSIYVKNGKTQIRNLCLFIFFSLESRVVRFAVLYGIFIVLSSYANMCSCVVMCVFVVVL